MSNSRHRIYLILLGLIPFLLLLGGCSDGGDPSPTRPVSTGVGIDEQPDIPATPTIKPSPTLPLRTMTICLGTEPESLFIYGENSLSQNHILEAIYDGPIDLVGYQYQPVILESLPSLDQGEAALESVPVEAGDLVVNETGQLVRLQPGEVVRPYGCQSADCAVTWQGDELQMGQLSATFTLIEGIKWSDSTPLTAADSVFSYQIARQCEAESGPCGGLGLATRQGGSTLARTSSYDALDERRVRWTGVPGFLDPDFNTNFFIPLPEHQLVGFELPDLFNSPEANRQPLGWGPYIIMDWIPGDFISLRKNPLYFRIGEAEPKFDRLIFRFLGQEAGTNLAAVTGGGCDMLDQGAAQVFLGGEVENIQQLEASGQLRNYFASGPVWEHADFGIRPASYDDGYQQGVDRPDFFSDARVRQAVAFCMDRQRIISELLNGLSKIPGSYLPGDHPLFNPSVRQYDFDPGAGSQLLTEAGWLDADGDPSTPRVARGVAGVSDGTPFAVTYTTSDALQRQEAAGILSASLRECGIQLDLLSGDAEEIYAPGPQGPVFGRRFEMTQFAWASGPNPLCYLWTSQQIPGDPNLKDEQGEAVFPYGWSGVNETGFSLPAYDQACARAMDSLPSQPGYVEAQQAAQEIFSEQLPVIPLYQHLKLVVSHPDMCGLEFDASNVSEMWNIENFNVGEGCP